MSSSLNTTDATLPTEVRDGLHTAQLIILTFLIIMGLALSPAALVEPDLGWHLAGGFWMIDNLQVPQVDPLGSTGNQWLAYSWLFEVIVAMGFRLGGFFALQLMQGALVILSLLSLWWLTGTIAGLPATPATLLRRLVAVLMVLPLLTPFWYLRPQACGLLFFVAILGLGESKRLRPALFLPITILWANIHLYVLIAPAVIATYSILPHLHPWDLAKLRRGCLWTSSACVALLINPYGLELLNGMRQYLLQHSNGYRFISEFQPISHGDPLLLVSFAAVLLALLFALKSITRDGTISSLPLLFPLTIEAVLRLKYAPLFGIAALPPLVRSVLPRLIPQVTLDPVSPGRERTLLLGLFCSVIITIIAISLVWPPPIGNDQQELFLLADKLMMQSASTTTTRSVLTHFDDGGWLEFAFANKHSAPGSSPKLLPTTDGRTLVMGEEKLEEFPALFQSAPGWCDILLRWNPPFAILPRYVPLASHLVQGDPCGMRWKVLGESEHFVLLEHGPLS